VSNFKSFGEKDIVMEGGVGTVASKG
jgi:hypothetical protein